jgi:trans-aconitate 2-methyltransferase
LSAWSPDQYEKFKAERAQPFWDLVALIDPRPGMRIADLGCGTGELTRALHEKLQARETIGIDSSASMLAKAQAHVLRFRQQSIESFNESGFDLIFSNAALHWVADHEALFRRLAPLSQQIAVQMPANDDHPSHAIAAEVARELGMQPKPVHVLAPERYSQLLFELGYRQQHVRLQIYGHVLPSSEDVIEWVKGTLLTFYESEPRFMERYPERLLARIGVQRPYFYTYKRLLIWAAK